MKIKRSPAIIAACIGVGGMIVTALITVLAPVFMKDKPAPPPTSSSPQGQSTSTNLTVKGDVRDVYYIGDRIDHNTTIQPPKENKENITQPQHSQIPSTPVAATPESKVASVQERTATDSQTIVPSMEVRDAQTSTKNIYRFQGLSPIDEDEVSRTLRELEVVSASIALSDSARAGGKSVFVNIVYKDGQAYQDSFGVPTVNTAEVISRQIIKHSRRGTQ